MNLSEYVVKDIISITELTTEYSLVESVKTIWEAIGEDWPVVYEQMDVIE